MNQRTMSQRLNGVASIVGLGCVLALAAGCASDTGTTPHTSTTSAVQPPDGLSGEALTAWNKWQAAGIDDYSYDLSVICFCANRPNGHVTVRDGHAESADPTKALTAEDLFTQIAKAQRGADSVDLKFDEATGFPTEIAIDYVKDAIDDEVTYETHNLHT
jgi:hypothetical protein